MTTQQQIIRGLRIAAIVAIVVLLWWRLGVWPFAGSPPVGPDDPAAAPIPAEQVLQSAIMAGDYLKRGVGKDGRFVYLYDPLEDKVIDEYNIVRHAAAVYALSELYSQTGDEELLAVTKRTLVYLLAHVYDVPLSAVPKARLIDDDWAMLGGAAVAILAITEYTKVSGDRTHLPQAVKLANWICSLIETNGSFKYHDVQIKLGRRVVNESPFYPGQVIFSLMRLNQVDPNEMWVLAATRVAGYVINVRDADTTELTQEHDHWSLYGFAELCRIKPDKRYLDHAEWIARVMVAGQVTETVNDAWVGGFSLPPGSIPTATRIEGLAAIYPVLRDQGRTEHLPSMRACINRAVRFEFRNQYDKTRAAACANPTRTLGGFANSLESPYIRIDGVQHNISAMLGVYRLDEKKTD